MLAMLVHLLTWSTASDRLLLDRHQRGEQICAIHDSDPVACEVIQNRLQGRLWGRSLSRLRDSLAGVLACKLVTADALTSGQRPPDVGAGIEKEEV